LPSNRALSPTSLFLVVHKNGAFLKRSHFQICRGLWIQLDQFLKLLRLAVHCVGKVRLCLCLLFAFKSRRERFELYIALQVEEECVIVEQRIGWQLHEPLLVLIKHFDKTLSDKNHFAGLSAAGLNFNIWGVDACIKLNNKFVAEPLFARVEEVVKSLNEVLEKLFN
jgi:hypothetical protein